MSAAVVIVAFISLINRNKGQQIPLERCVDGEIVKCVRAPCDDATCPRYPDAVCMNDYCNGCNARFFDKSDTQYQHELNCEESEQESGCRTAGCSGELCVSKDSDIAASVCIFKCEFKCKQFQICGINENGDCEWSTNKDDVSKYEECMKSCAPLDGDGDGKICACPMIYNPICCNGKTYSNPCNAECEGITKPAEKQRECVMGECPKICRCTMEYNPICCNGKTYPNPCSAECKGGIKKPAEKQPQCVMGECKKKKVCPCQDIYHPICCNGKTYDNECMAECDGISPPPKAQEECYMGKCRNEL